MFNIITATLLNLQCPTTIVQVPSRLEWNDVDVAHLKIATRRCSSLYRKSPCLIRFRKVESLTYQATCGIERSEYPTDHERK